MFKEEFETNASDSKLNRALVICIIILCLIRGIPCNCVLPDNATAEERELLASIEPLKGLEFTADNQVGGAKKQYRVRICDKVSGANDDAAGAVQYSSNKKNITLGLINITGVMGGTDWLMLTYYNGLADTKHRYNGSERTTLIMMFCDPGNVIGEFKLLEEKLGSNVGYSFYLFELRSSLFCSTPAATSRSLSSGNVFCILFFAFVALYFIFGSLYQRLVVGAKGLEQIPHYSFWKALGNLQADICNYICRCRPRPKPETSRGIDQRLKMEEQ